jgi:serine/threonine protein kinase
MDLTNLANQLNKIDLISNIQVSSHCKCEPGDIVGGNEIVRKLGKGRFAIVYEIKNNSNNVAIKIFRVGSSIMSYFTNEVKILNKIFMQSLTTGTPPPNIVQYLGTYAHISIGVDKAPNIHPCIIFNLCGDTVSSLLKYCKKNYGGGLPLPMVKKIMRDVFSGLSYLHSIGIIHTDIKLSNLLLDKQIDQIVGTNFNVCLGDLGSSTEENDLFSYHVGTTEYCAVELILELKYNFAIDIWAAFIVCYELITGDLLFDVYNECNVEYGDDIKDDLLSFHEDESNESDSKEEMKNIDCQNNCEGCEQCCGPMSHSDSSGDEFEDFKKVNYRHLLLIEKVLGKAPKKITKNGREYYNAKGKLKNNPHVEHVSISQLLANNYDMDATTCKNVEEFLLLGLKYNPNERISAADALLHPFLLFD